MNENILSNECKDYLINQLQRTINMLCISTGSLTLLFDPNYQTKLSEVEVFFGDLKFDLKNLDSLFSKENALQETVFELSKQYLRTCLKECFEHIITYAKKTNQFEVVRAANWFHFARIMRNSLSHKVKIEIQDRDMKLLPIIWNDIVIDEVMIGKELEITFFQPEHILKICIEMKEWAKSELN